MKEYQIGLEIFEGNAGEFQTDGSYPDFAREGICAWMYGGYQAGRVFRYPDDLGKLCPWLVDSMTPYFCAKLTGDQMSLSTLTIEVE